LGGLSILTWKTCTDSWTGFPVIGSADLHREPAAREYCGGVSHGTWYAWRRQGLIEPIKVGRMALYDQQDLDLLIDRLRQGEGESAFIADRR
jgi:hypothetical protein